MHSEAATIGEIVHPVAGSRGTVAILVVGAVVGSGTGGKTLRLWRRSRSATSPEAAPDGRNCLAAELGLVEQLLSFANAPFRPTALQIVEEMVGRAEFWRRGASLQRRAEFQHFLMLRGLNPVCRAMSPIGGSGHTQSMDLTKDGLPRATMRRAGQVSMFCDFAWATRERITAWRKNPAHFRV